LNDKLDFDRVNFPCVGEYTDDGTIWKKGKVLGLYSKGSSTGANNCLLQYWGVIDSKGNFQTIYNLKNVRFINGNS
jgi:hypothetical protein